MRRFGIQWLALILLICGITGVLAGYSQKSSATGENRPSAQSAAEELKLLYKLGQKEISSPTRVTVKLQGERALFSGQELDESARWLAREMGLTTVRIEEDQEGKAYRARATVKGVSIRLDWVQAGDRSYAKIQLEASGEDGLSHMLELQDRGWYSMLNAGVTPAWNAAIQGNVSNGGSAVKTADFLEQSLDETLPLKVADSYEDTTTVSRSYHVPSLSFDARSGSAPIHMQVAVHEDSVKKNNRITIGFPVITVEY